ncbi:hypothetical protein AA313_de0202850 [Arthrobotrys entomopaga]|nr:hypothetical protein AA313_de0202850 [Arthrobotrys entomopaga]
MKNPLPPEKPLFPSLLLHHRSNLRNNTIVDLHNQRRVHHSLIPLLQRCLHPHKSSILLPSILPTPTITTLFLLIVVIVIIIITDKLLRHIDQLRLKTMLTLQTLRQTQLLDPVLHQVPLIE